MNRKNLYHTLVGLMLAQTISAQTLPADEQLLFHLSCDQTLQADYHEGNGQPNYVSSISLIEDGVQGRAFRCGEGQLLTYWAPGNIYAQRGTLSLWWRSGIELTDTEFPIWRVAYADHSSWDMVWMRIDYNGQGFDAFVTDNGLSRIRVSYQAPQPLDPQHWYHLVFSWDENCGVQLWVDGKMVAEKLQPAVLDAGLDQMGPHSRVISPYQVQTAYNCIRGGDIDEIRIYSHSLFDNQQQAQEEIQNAWMHRHGFDAETKAPLLSSGPNTLRKVQIHKVYDEKRWYWKGCDGIAETTWPGVYNRSRLAGRFDYIQLPDWDCYSTSGKRVRMVMPDETWNQIELTGSAFGTLSLSPDTIGNNAQAIGLVKQDEHRTILRLDQTAQGQTLVFDNVLPEEPIQELDAYYIHEGKAPQGVCRLSYSLSAFQHFEHPTLKSMASFIDGRYPEGERQKLLALPENKNPNKTSFTGTQPLKGRLEVDDKEPEAASGALPFFHLIIPNDVRDLTDYLPQSLDGTKAHTGDTGLATITRSLNYSWRFMQGGLDGILLELPAIATHGHNDLQVNIQVKDPVWALRNMMDVTFSIHPDQAYSLWLDTRDRILPNDKPLYITLAFSDPRISAEQLSQMSIQLVFKDYEEAKREHIEDRLVQIIDSHGMLVEEGTSSRKLNKYLQLESDMEDLLRVDPNNSLGRKYWYQYNNEQAAPAFVAPVAPTGVPQWAHLQLEVLREYRELLEWYIDNRQIENGEFGGGLSDDTDLGNLFPGLVANGSLTEKAPQSLRQMLEAIYDQGLLTRGMSSLMTDGLHTYEEGVNTIVQCNIMQPGDPLLVERMMEAAQTVGEWLLGRNEQGHLHFRSDYFSADRMATEGLWTWSSPREFLHLAPACLLGEYYAHADARRYILEFAESLLAHAEVDTKGEMQLPVEVNYLTDEVRRWGTYFSIPVLGYSYLWTGDERYLKPLLTTSAYRDLTQTLTTEQVEQQCMNLLRNINNRRFMMREGSVWIDRVYFSCDEIQRQRLGGIALNRGSNYVPGNAVSWRFEQPEMAQKVAILIPKASRNEMEIIFWNTDTHAVKVEMTGVEVLGGKWQVNGKEQMWGRNRSLSLTIPARKEYHVTLKLIGEGVEYNTLPDWALSKQGLKLSADQTQLTVTLCNLGATEAPATQLELKEKNGKKAVSVPVSALEPTQHFKLGKREVTLNLPEGFNLDGAILSIDPKQSIEELFEYNNQLILDNGVNDLHP